MVAATVGGGVSTGAIAWGDPPAPLVPYNVTFGETALDYGYCSGWSRYGYETQHNFTMEVENLTWVYFTFVWSDKAGSPLKDPDVQLTFSSPNGTVIYNGPGPMTEMTWNISLNPVPADAVVPAASAEEALAQSLDGTGVNQTLGMGVWNWTLDVGPMPYARNQIRSGVHYDCWWGYGTFGPAVANDTMSE